MFHSAEWDHEHRPDAAAGSRSSAPARARSSSSPRSPRSRPRPTIYQRSAPWILPKSDRLYREWERRLFRRFPARVAASRLGPVRLLRARHLRVHRHRRVLAPFRKIADRERHRQLGDDPELLAKATPDYTIGCKRVLFTSDWYPTLRRDDVELVTAAVERVTAGGDRRRRTGSSARPT